MYTFLFNEFINAVSDTIAGRSYNTVDEILRETTTFYHPKSDIKRQGVLRLTQNGVSFETRSLFLRKPIVQFSLNEIQYVFASGQQLTLGICARSHQYSMLFWIHQVPELRFPLTHPKAWQRILDKKIRKQWYRCHCGAGLRQYVYMKEKQDFYQVCPHCWCRVQRLEYRRVRNKGVTWWWRDLPRTLCPSMEVMPDVFPKHYILHAPTKHLSLAQHILCDDNANRIRYIYGLLKDNWKLRKKRINGRHYAYGQRRTEYQALGPWKHEYDCLLQPTSVHV